MLRNLLYSVFFHIIFVALLFISTIDFNTDIVQTEITPLTISFINEDNLDELKKIKNEKVDDRVKDMTIEEKIDLYNKLKNSKDAKKNKQENKFIYEKSNKLTEQKAKQKLLNPTEENEFSYYYTPIYVSEDKVNTEEKRKLIENRLKREELRKKIKEKKMIPEVNIEELQTFQKIDDVIKISQKPLIVKKKKDKKIEKDEKIKKEISEIASNSKEQKKIIENKEIKEEVVAEVVEDSIEENSDLDDLIQQMNNNLPSIEKEYEDLSENNIFTNEDYEALKNINENEDSKYKLSLREKKNIQRQIKGCYKMAILRNKVDSKAIIGLTIQVRENGTIDMSNIKVNKIVDNFDSESFNIALNNAKSALVFCSPLRGLPQGKYRMWRNMTFIFDSNNLE